MSECIATAATTRARKAPQLVRWLALSLGAVIGASTLVASPLHANEGGTEYARSSGSEYETPGAGTLWLSNEQSGQYQADALLLDSRFTLNVSGLLAELTLKQSFSNTTDQWLDGTYLFPLPGDAAVRGLQLRVGERTVTGRIQTREDATKTYETARREGRVAGLIEQQRPNLFTARIASIAPGSTIDVTFDVLIPVQADDKALSLTLPTTLTPRYANAHAANARAVSSPTLRADQIRGPRFDLEARIAPLNDPTAVSSPSHDISAEDNRLVIDNAPMDRDLVLRWPYAQGDQAAAFSFVGRHREHRYAQMFMAPPASLDETARLARELILVVDTSGSMAGVSIEAAQEAAQSALDGLQDLDTFNLIAFDDKTTQLFDTARPVTERNLAMARRFVRSLSADGGTEMSQALTRALRPHTSRTERVMPVRAGTPLSGKTASDIPQRNRSDSHDDSGSSAEPSSTAEPIEERLRQVVFLTDGSIADEDRLINQIRRDIGSSRLFTVGIGSAPNGWFLDKAAEVGRGTALAIRNVEDVADAVSELLGRLAHPVLTDITIEFPEGGGESYPARVPDLYADRPLMVVARLEGGSTEAIVRGWRGGEPFVQRLSLATARTAEPLAATKPEHPMEGTHTPRVAPGLAVHWAREKVAYLLDQQRHSRNDARHRAEITALGLDVGLVTPYTSFVAVEDTPVRTQDSPSTDTDVANLMPAGNEMLSIAIPQGAAGIDTLGLLALFAALMGSGLLWLSRVWGRVPRDSHSWTLR